MTLGTILGMILGTEEAHIGEEEIPGIKVVDPKTGEEEGEEIPGIKPPIKQEN